MRCPMSGVFQRLGFIIRETGQALDRLGCRLQGNNAFLEEGAPPLLDMTILIAIDNIYVTRRPERKKDSSAGECCIPFVSLNSLTAMPQIP